MRQADSELVYVDCIHGDMTVAIDPLSKNSNKA